MKKVPDPDSQKSTDPTGSGSSSLAVEKYWKLLTSLQKLINAMKLQFITTYFFGAERKKVFSRIFIIFTTSASSPPPIKQSPARPEATR